MLTPAYDLLCTKIHSSSESEMALTLFKDGFSETYEAYGFYTYQDFYSFGLQLGIKESRVKKIIEEFISPQVLVYNLINKSFLEDEIKVITKEYYQDRVKRLKMGS